MLEQEKASCSLAKRSGPEERRVKHYQVATDSKPPSLSTSIESAASEIEVTDLDPSQFPLHRKNSMGQHLTTNRFHELVTQFGQEQPQYNGWTDKIGTHSQVCLSTADLRGKGITHNDKPEKSHMVDGPESQEGVDVLSNLPRLARVVADSKTSELVQPTGQPLRRASSVVHGFHPNCLSVDKSITDGNREAAGTMSHGKNMFFIESSPSDSDAEDQASSLRSKGKSVIHGISKGRSSVSPSKATTRKHTSFREIVDECSGYDSSPFDSDSEEESCTQSRDRGESAILSDDEVEGDDADWDSICTESRLNSPTNGHLFNKVEGLEARPGLTSRKSILSTLLTNPMTRLSSAHSKSSPAIAQSRMPSPVEAPLESQICASKADFGAGTPVLATKATPIKGSLSPRSTRRNMLATELSESLRRHLLWERKQKSSSTMINTASQAVLQRRHTACDLSKVQQYPAPATSFEQRLRPDLASENEFGYNGAGW